MFMSMTKMDRFLNQLHPTRPLGTSCHVYSLLSLSLSNQPCAVLSWRHLWESVAKNVNKSAAWCEIYSFIIKQCRTKWWLFLWSWLRLAELKQNLWNCGSCMRPAVLGNIGWFISTTPGDTGPIFVTTAQLATLSHQASNLFQSFCNADRFGTI